MNGTITYFIYSDEGLIAEVDATGAITKTYGYQPDGIWGTDPVWMRTNGQYHWFHNDHLGTPMKLTSSNGAVTWSATYSAFGKAVVSVNTVENNLRFPGQYYDDETGLHYNLSRYYDSTSGRYTVVDPIGFKGGINFFRYANNNSINKRDNLGLVCGSGWTDGGWFTDKEGLVFNVYDFSGACAQHDACYAKCESKQVCDQQFCSDMTAACNSISPWLNAATGFYYSAKCRSQATTFCSIVKGKFGQSAYDKSCKCKKTP